MSKKLNLSLLFILLGLLLLSSTVAQAQVETKLLASDGAAEDYFGKSSDLDGDVLIAGAENDDDNGTDAGAAYVFRYNGSTWSEEQKLLASDGATGDLFGLFVSIDGNVAVVGAHLDDDNGLNSGAVYVFRYNGSTWVQEQKLLASDGAAEDVFGYSAVISDNLIAVTAHLDDDNGINSGSAYIFHYDGSTWIQEQKLLAGDGAAGDTFGDSIDIANNLVLIGTQLDDDNGTDSGSAYIFHYNGSTWIQEQKLLASDGTAGDEFGVSASVMEDPANGDLAMIGAFHDDDNGANSGSAYIFHYNGSTWIQEQKLLASDGTAGDIFGIGTKVDENMIIVGAMHDDDNGNNSGSAYIFQWDSVTWNQEQKLVASDISVGDLFGASVSIEGTRALVGSFFDDDNGFNSGSAYVYELTNLDVDDDGFSQDAGDCDDQDNTIFPGQTEIPDDGIDQDCSGVDTITCHTDADQDGDGATPPLLASDGSCDTVDSESANNNDCNDNDASINTSAIEICDGIDQNCNNTIDEGFDLDGDGETSCAGDCDDSNPSINTNATEICDGIDQNCDNNIDEGFDSDGDGQTSCAGDCDDTNPLINTNGTEIPDNNIDEDCSGTDTITCFTDSDGDGQGTTPILLANDGSCDTSENESSNNDDCNDSEASIYLGAPETPNDGIDQNCSGTDTVTCFTDTDGDNFGEASSPSFLSETGCVGADESTNNFDCDDSSPAVRPGVGEICGDNIDNNCDGNIDENFDNDGDGFETCENDCNDNDASIHPGATEICDSVDQNCDGNTDEGFDTDGDGQTTCAGDCDDSNPLINTNVSEVCGDGVDNNCNAQIDEGFDNDGDDVLSCNGDCNDNNPNIYPGANDTPDDGVDQNCSGTDTVTCFIDGDGDGFGSEATVLSDDGSCKQPGESMMNNDCDDTSSTIYPGAEEICGDKLDNNCNVTIDESTDNDGDGFSNCENDCNDDDASIYPDAKEVCDDGIDQDCNGEDFVCEEISYDESRMGYLTTLTGFSFDIGTECEGKACEIQSLQVNTLNNQDVIEANDEEGIDVATSSDINSRFTKNIGEQSAYTWKHHINALVFDRDSFYARSDFINLENEEGDEVVRGTKSFSLEEDLHISELSVPLEELKFAVFLRGFRVETTNGQGTTGEDLWANIRFINNGEGAYAVNGSDLSDDQITVEASCDFNGAPLWENPYTCRVDFYIAVMTADWQMRWFSWYSSPNAASYDSIGDLWHKTQRVETEPNIPEDQMFLGLVKMGLADEIGSALEIDRLSQRAEIGDVDPDTGEVLIDMEGMLHGYFGHANIFPSNEGETSSQPDELKGFLFYCQNDRCKTAAGSAEGEETQDKSTSERKGFLIEGFRPPREGQQERSKKK